jgi:hypothetical protein
MTDLEFRNIVNSVLENLHSKEEYAELCEKSWDFDNAKGLIKSAAQEVHKELNLDFKIAGTDKMFYKDYFFDTIQIRFMIPYGYGFLDCSYRVFKGMTDNSIPSFSFRDIVEFEKGHDENQTYRFPMFKNKNDFTENLTIILRMNDDIILMLDEEISKLNLKNN